MAPGFKGAKKTACGKKSCQEPGEKAGAVNLFNRWVGPAVQVFINLGVFGIGDRLNFSILLHLKGSGDFRSFLNSQDGSRRDA